MSMITSSKRTVDLNWGQVSELIAEELLWDYENLDPNTRPDYGVFDNDEEADLKKIKKMRKALKLVLSYYGKNV